MSKIDITKEQAALMVNIINYYEDQQELNLLDENEEELRCYLENEMLSKLTLAQAIRIDYHVGCVFKTSGYFATGDGGHGEYVVKVAADSVIDGLSIIEMDNGCQAHLVRKFTKD